MLQFQLAALLKLETECGTGTLYGGIFIRSTSTFHRGLPAGPIMRTEEGPTSYSMGCRAFLLAQL